MSLIKVVATFHKNDQYRSLHRPQVVVMASQKQITLSQSLQNQQRDLKNMSSNIYVHFSMIFAECWDEGRVLAKLILKEKAKELI